jgi:acetylornithine deacetylase/succinyl-diaminopimelate desuccinylase-like protein
MERTGPKDEDILRDADVPRDWGEAGYSLYERVTIRPALTLNGINGGYNGAGVKTVIPARATAKMSIRLVPDQNPREVEQLVRRHIVHATPSSVSVKMKTLGVSNPALVNRNHPALRAAAFAYQKGFGSKPVFLRSGGSVPAASIFQKSLGIPTVLMGFALPDDRIHAPNEKFHLPNFYRGIETSIWYLAAAGKLENTSRQNAPQKAWHA